MPMGYCTEASRLSKDLEKEVANAFQLNFLDPGACTHTLTMTSRCLTGKSDTIHALDRTLGEAYR